MLGILRTRVFPEIYRRWFVVHTSNGGAFILYAVLLPALLFAQLLDLRGLYLLGDADWPLRPYPLDYLIPWQDRGAAGADNTFIGVPRLVFYALTNGTLFLGHGLLQFSQWLWFVVVFALGIAGALALARRLDAGFAAPFLAVFYACNLESYGRLAHGPLLLSYEAVPLVVLLLIGALQRPSVVRSLCFAISTALLLGSFQVAYLAVAICLAITIAFVFQSPLRTLRALAILVPLTVASNAFFLFPAIVIAFAKSQNELSLVSARFDSSVFAGYASNATFLRTVQLASFAYSSFDRQPLFVKALTFVPIVMILAIANVTRFWRDRRVLGGFICICAGLFLIDGINYARPVYEAIRSHVPGLSFFVDPDYFAVLLPFGFLVIAATSWRTMRRRFPRLWLAAMVALIVLGIVPFIPLGHQDAGLPISGVPGSYVKFAHQKVQGRTLWMPRQWVAAYRWSPYLINGFLVENSPSAAVGPEMLEWTPPGTLDVTNALADRVDAADGPAAARLARILSVGEVAFAADTENDDVEVVRDRRLLAAWKRDGIIDDYEDNVDTNSELITARFPTTRPLVDLNSLPIISHDNRQTAVALGMQSRYVPIETSPRGMHQDVPSSELFSARSIGIVAHAGHSPGDCADASEKAKLPQIGSSKIRVPGSGTHCAWFERELPSDQAIYSVSADIVGVGSDAVPAVQGIFLGDLHDPLHVDFPMGARQRGYYQRPAWAKKIKIILPGVAKSEVSYSNLRLMRYVAKDRTEPTPCNRGSLSSSRKNGGSYLVRASFDGTCSIILRQSFNELWKLRILRGRGLVVRHFLADGYANGWVVTSHGRIELAADYEPVRPYFVGLAISLSVFALFVVVVGWRLSRGLLTRWIAI